MDVVRSGVTRYVLLTKRYAIKIVRPRGGMGLVRAYLANQSEWRQRFEQNVNGPLATVLHLATLSRRASTAGTWEPENAPIFVKAIARSRSEDFGWRSALDGEPQNNEECKGSSWGLVDGSWLLIDYDRAWAQPRRGIICKLYYWNQERLARRWMKLPND